MQGGIGGTGEAHIDDARGVVRRPLQAFVDGERRSVGLVLGAVERARRQQRGVRRDAQELTVRGNRTRHGRAVPMRSLFTAQRIEAFHDRAFQIRIVRVDFGIDHRDRNILSRRDLMRPNDLQFFQHVLRRVALRTGHGFCHGLLEAENIIRLGVHDDAFVLERADRVCHRTAAVEAPAIKRGADQGKALNFQVGQIVAARDLTDRLRRRSRRNFRDDFIRNKSSLALWRNAAVVVAAAGCALPRHYRTGITAAATDNAMMSRPPR